MTAQPIDPGGLPAPDIMTLPDDEQVVSEIKQLLLKRNPDYAELLEQADNPLAIGVEIFVRREQSLRQQMAQAVKSNLLAFATGADLDQLGGFYGVTRLQPATEGKAAESDQAFRLRIKTRILGAAGGGAAHYRYQALSVSPEIEDIGVDSPAPGKVRVSVLAKNGITVEPLVKQVNTRITAADVQLLTDSVEVVAAELIKVDITADLIAAENALGLSAKQISRVLSSAIEQQRRLGRDLVPSWLISQLHGTGIKEVRLHHPAATIAAGPNQCVQVRSITLSLS